MRIGIFTEAGDKFGFGHLTRCAALADGFKSISKRNHVDFYLDGDTKAKTYAARLGIKPGIIRWQSHVSKVAKIALNYDSIVLDSYHAPKQLYDTLGETLGHRLLIMDDYKRLNYSAGIVLNPAVQAEKLNYPKRKEVLYLLGPSYCLLRKPFWKMPQKKIALKVRNILISFGAAVEIDFLNKLISFINENFKFNIHIVYPKKSSFKLPANVRWYQNMNAQEMKRLMIKCDLAVSAGGQTLFELLRAGLPTVAAQIAGNQKYNLQFFAEKKLLRHLGEYKQKAYFSVLKKEILKFQNREERKKISTRMQRFSSGDGALKAASEITRQVRKMPATQIRTAVKNDSYDLWCWRNHPKTRAVSLNSDPIPYTDHQKWLKKTLASPRSKIMIMETNKKGKVGQVRFDREGRKAYISIALNPSYIGKGFGQIFIVQSTRKYLIENPEIKSVFARIQSKNRRSLRAFSNAHYKKCAAAKQGILLYEYQRKF